MRIYYPNVHHPLLYMRIVFEYAYKYKVHVTLGLSYTLFGRFVITDHRTFVHDYANNCVVVAL